MSSSFRKLLIRSGVLFFWIGFWFLAARITGSELLLPSPMQVLLRLLQLSLTATFWKTILLSLARVIAGIAGGAVVGVFLALLTERFPPAKELFSPVMTLVKTTPVASFIILALIWLGRDILPSFIAGLMVLPVVWANLSAGIESIDRSFLELAKVYKLPKKCIFRRITVPSVLPHFRAALSSALGLGWKAGIAAEVLTVPQMSIGKNIFESKLYLETTDLFAWTLAVILLSLILEKLLLQFTGKRQEKGERDGA